MAEYNDLRGRVVVRAELPTRRQLKEVLQGDGPVLILTLDDGTRVLGDVLTEGDNEEEGLFEVAESLLFECDLQGNVGSHGGADDAYELMQETVERLRTATKRIER